MKIFKFDKLFDSFGQYMEDRLALLKLELKEEFAKAIAKLSLVLVLLLVFLHFVLFLSITVGSALNQLWKSDYLGYGAVTLFYLLLFIILYFIRKNTSLNEILEQRILEKMKEKEQKDTDL